VSEEGKALLKRLLVVDVNSRLSAEDALKHIWFKKFKKMQKGCDEDKLDEGLVKQLREYRGESALKKAAMNVLVKMLDIKDIELLRDTFLKIDTDNTGFISAPELKTALSHDNYHIPEEEI
jgi:calcium-dependent protein kinase